MKYLINKTEIRKLAIEEFDKDFPDNKDVILLYSYVRAFTKAYEILTKNINNEQK